jgi:SAM-dependent methyltransferase
MDAIIRLTMLSIDSMKITPKIGNDEVRYREPRFNGYEIKRGLINYHIDLAFNIKEYVQSKMKSDDYPQDEEYIVLELGCGSGGFLSDIQQVDPRITGFGITDKLYTREHSREKIIVGNYAKVARAENYVLPIIPSNSIDLVVSNKSLKYVDNVHYEEIFRQSYRLLKRGGLAILCVSGGELSDDAIAQMRQNHLPIKAHRWDDNHELMTVRINK